MAFAKEQLRAQFRILTGFPILKALALHRYLATNKFAAAKIRIIVKII